MNRRYSFRTETPTELFYPIQLRVMADEEIREYYLKKFAEWGRKWEQE